MKTQTRTSARARKPKTPTLRPLPPDAVLLAIDASSSAVGWCVYVGGKFDAAGRVAAPASRPSDRRIEANTEELVGIARDYGVTWAVMEWQSAYRHARLRNANGLAVLGQSQGAAWWALRALGIPVDRISEREWTKIGGWNASKEKRAARVRLLCPEYRWAVEKSPSLDAGYDIADSIGLALFRLSK